MSEHYLTWRSAAVVAVILLFARFILGPLLEPLLNRWFDRKRV